MNGIHDMGGMHGWGPVVYEKDELVFHAPWEGRVYAMTRAMSAFGEWNIDASRHSIEILPPNHYLRSYYERWLAALENRLVKYGFVSQREIDRGKASPGSSRANPRLTPEAARQIDRGIASSLEPSIVPRFLVGQHVRARNIQPTGHTRLPRYARGKTGVIHLDHGVYVFPDTNAHHQGGASAACLLRAIYRARDLGRNGLLPRLYSYRSLG